MRTGERQAEWARFQKESQSGSRLIYSPSDLDRRRDARSESSNGIHRPVRAGAYLRPYLRGREFDRRHYD